MVVQAADNGWDLATNIQEQVVRLKAAIPSFFCESGDSHFGGRLMKVKQDFLQFGSFVIIDGS